MILNQDNEYTVLLDACVLAPMPACDTLLRLAQDPALYMVRWTNEILDEVRRAILKFGYSETQAQRRIARLREIFPDAEVHGYESLIPCVTLPDPNDRHVVASAIRAGAQAIVTNNLKHFPVDVLAPFGIVRQSLDDFLCHQFSLSPRIVLERLEQQASGIRSELPDLLIKLSKAAPRFTKSVRNHQAP